MNLEVLYFLWTADSTSTTSSEFMQCRFCSRAIACAHGRMSVSEYFVCASIVSPHSPFASVIIATYTADEGHTLVHYSA